MKVEGAAECPWRRLLPWLVTQQEPLGVSAAVSGSRYVQSLQDSKNDNLLRILVLLLEISLPSIRALSSPEAPHARHLRVRRTA